MSVFTAVAIGVLGTITIMGIARGQGAAIAAPAYAHIRVHAYGACPKCGMDYAECAREGDCR